MREVLQLTRLGLNQEEVAEEMGISPVSIWNWRNRYPQFAADFNAALEAGQNHRV